MVRRTVWYLALVLLLAGVAHSQDEERRGRERPSPRITLVIDVSGSMDGAQINKAISVAAGIAITTSDDLEVGIFVFNGTAIRLVNPINKSIWFRLPSVAVAEALTKSLKELGADGDTNPNDALRQAFAEKTQTIVLITDGEFDTLGASQAVRDAQKARERAKLTPVTFVIICVQSSAYHTAKLQIMADETGGLLWNPDEEEEEAKRLEVRRPQVERPYERFRVLPSDKKTPKLKWKKCATGKRRLRPIKVR